MNRLLLIYFIHWLSNFDNIWLRERHSGHKYKIKHISICKFTQKVFLIYIVPILKFKRILYIVCIKPHKFLQTNFIKIIAHNKKAIVYNFLNFQARSIKLFCAFSKVIHNLFTNSVFIHKTPVYLWITSKLFL